MDWGWPDNNLIIVFGFVIVVVLINAIASVFKSNQTQKTVREALKAGQPLDAKTVEALGLERSDGGGGSVTGGFILIAVAVGLVLLAYFGGDFAGEPDAVIPMIGVAAIPALIGVVLVFSGLFNRNKN